MESHGPEEIPMEVEIQRFKNPIEIRILTLDSRTYNLRVDKHVPIPALKQHIASLTGLLSERQHLLCCGRVLKDDQLLSAYHVEDGHTLHLVTKQPLPYEINTSSSHDSQVHFDHDDDDDFFFNEISNDEEEVDEIRIADQTDMGVLSVEPLSVLWPMFPPVNEIQDSLTTMNQYLDHMRHAFDAIWQPLPALNMTQERSSSGLPTPEALARLMLSTRQMLIDQAGTSLYQLARQLENQENVSDPMSRFSTELRAWRTGFRLQYLGAYLLELGRTTTTLLLGEKPNEAEVDSRPAVFISSSAPNPLAVQRLRFQHEFDQLDNLFREIQDRTSSWMVTPNAYQEEHNEIGSSGENHDNVTISWTDLNNLLYDDDDDSQDSIEQHSSTQPQDSNQSGMPQ
ncbi:ubiquitin domain-containing protein [Cephalotus follicularis]|uniref:Ubiquitin domain-containing protein n=1 Tax=Cephalotus follicularis TaxID=3775 RepID=A0A1Q3DHZ1_CEPFO|nr:ubiquitin domain-containing protein [Cephalotus follicularis]